MTMYICLFWIWFYIATVTRSKAITTVMYFSTRFPRSDQAVLSKVKCSKKCLNSAISTSLCVIATQWSPRGSIAPDWCQVRSQIRVRSREFIKACFCRKTHRFLPLYVLGNRSKTLLLLIICKRTDSPTASRLRSEGTSLKSHRLNINSSRDRICTFFRFRMDMDHYVLSSLASLLFPEP